MDQNSSDDNVSLQAEDRRGLTPQQAFDKKFDKDCIEVYPGQARWLDGDREMLVSVVGAGVALTIYDEQLRFGVLAHCILSPQVLAAFPNLGALDEAQIQRVLAPVETAIAEMKKHGAGKNRIRTRLFGGAAVTGVSPEDGLKTQVFVREYLGRKGVKIMSEDMGGQVLRRIYFSPHNGAVTRFVLRRQDDFEELANQESEYFID